MNRPTALVPLHYVSLGARGPEDVVADPHGRVLTGVSDGRILRIHHPGDPRTARAARTRWAQPVHDGIRALLRRNASIFFVGRSRRVGSCKVVGFRYAGPSCVERREIYS